jgi:hypothetical protein
MRAHAALPARPERPAEGAVGPVVAVRTVFQPRR